MSATLESKTFAGYFSETIRIPSQVRKIKVPAPILNIDAEPHEVIEYFLESIFALEGIDRVRKEFKLTVPKIHKSVSSVPQP